MANNKKHHKNVAKASVIATTLTSLAFFIITNIPTWLANVQDILARFSNDGDQAGDVYRGASPVIEGDCNLTQIGNGNSVTDSDLCPQNHTQQLHQTDHTYNQETQINFNESYTALIENNTAVSQSTSLSYHSAVNDWLIVQSLLAVMPMLEVAQYNSALTFNTVLTNKTNLKQTAFTKRLAAGLIEGEIDPALVKALGYDPYALLPNQIADTPSIPMEERVIPAEQHVNPVDKSDTKGTSKYPTCWRATVPPSGSNHCNKGDHLF
ncbi:MAG: hypothetical protein AAF821_15200 [Cyanobacteria bacterium P01_D01_bin.156]